MLKVNRLKKRQDFVEVSKKGFKSVSKGVVMQGKSNSLADETRVGFTVTKKVGCAVIRNKARRRMKEAWKQASCKADPSFDYVLIGRYSTVDRDFELLVKDIKYCLHKIKYQQLNNIDS